MTIVTKPSLYPIEKEFVEQLVPVRFADVGSTEIFVYRNLFCHKVDDTHIFVGIGSENPHQEPFNPERKVARMTLTFRENSESERR